MTFPRLPADTAGPRLVDGAGATLIDALLAALDEAAARELAERLRPFLGGTADSPRLLDASEFADHVGLHPETVVKMARTRRVWAIKVGREWRFRADRLEILAADGREASPPPRAAGQVSGARRIRASVEAIRGV